MLPAKGFANFLARLLASDKRNLFTVRLGVALFLGKIGLVGFVGRVVGFFLRSVLGVLIEDGIFLIDIGIDAYREGKKLKEFEREAALAYEKATAKIYDEEKKNEIRQQYLEIISRFGAVGSPKRVR